MTVEIGTVLNNLNKEEIVDLLKLCKGIGVKKFSVDMYIPTGRAVDNDLAIGMEEYVKVINKISDVTKLPPQKHLLPKCGVGHRKIVVSATGDILPCVAMPGLVLGNIRTHDLAAVMDESPILKAISSIGDIEACASCDAKMICCGGCRARAHAMSGKISAPDPAHCMLHRGTCPEER
jgi:radical SAM protein with 4Fe4S-binding SPASM domain